MVVTLALTAAVVIGVGDYWGGRASVRHPALVVTFFGQLVAAIASVAVVLIGGWTVLHRGDLLLGGVAGALGATVSTVMPTAVDAALTLPAASVAVAVSVCSPIVEP